MVDGLDVVAVMLLVESVLAFRSIVFVVLQSKVVFVFSVVFSIGVSSIIRVCLGLLPLISLSTLVRTLHSMVGGGMNLSLCAPLYRRMNSRWDLAIGSTSKKEGDAASGSITASCTV